MSTPSGYSGASAIAMCQLRTNEMSIPTPANILLLLNAAVEQVQASVGGVRLYRPYPTVNSETLVQLDSDIQDIISASWSTGPPTLQGVMVYRLQQLEQNSFMDAAGGFPATGFGPPVAFFIVNDYSSPTSSLLPAPIAPGLSVVPGTSAASPIYVVQTYTNVNGETTISPETAQSLTAFQQAQVQSPPGWGNANGYNVYVSLTSGSGYKLQNASPIALGMTFTIPGTLLTVTSPPVTNTATGYGSGGAMAIQLYPQSMQGQLNIYYRGRPQLWADTTSSSYTNLDSMAQEAVILWTCATILELRQRGDEAKGLWWPKFEKKIEDMREQMQRRTAPKNGVVYDIRSLSYPGANPWWW